MPHSGLSIAIVCGHFLPQLGYIEVDLARTFAQLGHRVDVVTTNIVPGYVRSKVNASLNIGQTEVDGYRIHRLKPVFSFGQIVICNGVRKTVNELKPELVITIGLGKRFPLPILDVNRPWKLLTLIGDNSAGYSRKRSLIDKLLKEGVYRKAVKNSDKILSYTPQSKGIVSNMLNSTLKRMLETKCHEISLGYDANHFYYSAEKRTLLREKLGLALTDRVAVTATRCSPEKNLDLLLKKMDQEIEKKQLHSYHLIGLADDETSAELKRIHRTLLHYDRIHLHDMMNKEDLLDYFHIADLGIWTRAAISIFQALGAGLPLILPTASSMDHVLVNGQGTRQEVDELDVQAAHSSITQDRVTISRSAADRFSNEVIAKSILTHADQLN